MDRNKTLYFRKTYRLLINSVVFRSKYNLHYSTNSFADSESLLCMTIVQPNKTIDITTVDVIEKGRESIDSQVFLERFR